MNRRAWKSVASAVMSLGLAGVLGAQAPTLNTKLGLWDMTMNIDMGAAMGGMDMSKMTPEQQAMMAGMMRGRGGAMPGMQMKMCMTAEKLAQARVAPERPGQDCTSKVTKSTTTTMDYTQTCTGTPASTSEMHLESVSPTNFKLTGKTTTTMRGGPPQTATITMTGTWVGEACGDVK